MKKWFQTGILALPIFALVACGGSDSAETESANEEAKQEACFYTFTDAASELEWTAFKFNKKAPVGGTFNEIRYEGEKKSDDVMALLTGLTFAINTSTVETQNEDRNGKIAEHFFGTINTDMLTGSFISLEDNGEATLNIEMNGKSEEVVGTYTLEKNVFAFKATIDVADWEGMEGIDALNTVCKDLHTGEDGVSKLWSLVDLSFTTTLQSDCN